MRRLPPPSRSRSKPESVVRHPTVSSCTCFVVVGRSLLRHMSSAQRRNHAKHGHCAKGKQKDQGVDKFHSPEFILYWIAASYIPGSLSGCIIYFPLGRTRYRGAISVELDTRTRIHSSFVLKYIRATWNCLLITFALQYIAMNILNSIFYGASILDVGCFHVEVA